MVRRLTDILIVLIFFGPPLLFAYTYTGPYQWLAELQLLVMRSYNEHLTFELTCLVWVAACGLIRIWIISRTQNVALSQVIRSADQMVGQMVPALLVVATLAMLALATYYEYRRATTFGPTAVDIADLPSKYWAPGRYLSIKGASPMAGAYITNIEGESNKSHYVPLVPEDYHHGQKVNVFVEVPDSKIRYDTVDPDLLRTGTVELLGLPGHLRLAFDRKDFPPADRCIVIEYGSTPKDLEGKADLCIFFAVLIVIAALIMRKKLARLSKRFR